MFYAPGLLYLHLPRTGGTFVADFLEKEGIGSRQLTHEVGGHDGVRSIPDNILEQSLVFGTLRDPWSWYASVDAHYRHRGYFDGFLHEMFGKSVPFKDVLRVLTRPASGAYLDRAVRYPGARVPEEKLARALADSGLGLYTWLVLRMYCKESFETVSGIRAVLDQCEDISWSVNAIIDTAQLRDGLGMVLDAWRPELGARLKGAVQTAPAKNEGSRFRGVLPTSNPDPAVYDQECQGWIREADGWLIRRFGFDLPVGRRRAVTLLGR